MRLKDIIPSRTKRELVNMIPPSERVTSRGYTTFDEVMAYLSEPRTIQELQARFNYKTLATAFNAIREAIKRGTVINLGHGLYVSAKANVNSFNLQDLPERELQERGYDKYKEQLKAKEAPVTLPEPEPVFAPVDPPRKVHGHVPDQALLDFLAYPKNTTEIAKHFNYSNPSVSYRRVEKLISQGKLKVAFRKKSGPMAQTMSKYYQAVDGAVANPPELYGTAARQRMSDDELLDFLVEPRTVKDIMDKWGFQSVTGPDKRLRRLARDGRVNRSLNLDPGRHGGGVYYIYQAIGPKPRIYDPLVAPMPEPEPKIERKIEEHVPEQALPELAPKYQTYSASDVEEKAMRYYWDRDIYSREDRQSVRDFIKWLSEQEKNNG